jgi:hypothetical protein
MSGVIVVGDAAAIAGAGAGTTSGTATGSTTASGPASTGTATDPLPLVALAVLAGIVVGAVGGWAASRRRMVREPSAVAPAA